MDQSEPARRLCFPLKLVVLRLWGVVRYTHSHSCICQMPAHIQDHMHICSCPACSDSAARSDRCQVWNTRPSLANEQSANFVLCKTRASHATWVNPGNWGDLLTFKKVGGEPGFVDRSIRHKLQPELVWAALDVFGFVMATEASKQRAALWTSVPHFHIVVGTAVMSLNLQLKQGQWCFFLRTSQINSAVLLFLQEVYLLEFL